MCKHRHNRKAWALIMAVFMLFLLSVPVSAADPTLSAEVKPSTDGKTVTVVFSVANNPGIAAYRFHINYDTSVLKPTVTSRGSKLTVGTYSDNIDTANGRLTVLWFFSKDFKADTELAVAYFSVVGEIKNGTYSIEATYDPADLINADLKTVGFYTSGVLEKQTAAETQSVTSSVTSSVQNAVSNPQSKTSSSSSVSAPVSSNVSPSVYSVLSAEQNSGLPTSSVNSVFSAELNSEIRIPDKATSDSSVSENSLQMPEYIPANSELTESTPSIDTEVSAVISDTTSDTAVPGAAQEKKTKADILTIIILSSALLLVTAFIILFIKKKGSKQV